MPHPSSLPVPLFAEKLKLLLLFNSKNQEWLAGSLRLTPANITRWKHEERVPTLHARGLCALLGIPVDLLTEPSMEGFGKELDARFALGSGERWKRFASAAQLCESLRIRSDHPRRPIDERRLAKLDFRRQTQPSALARVPRVTIGDQVRVVLTSSGAESDTLGPRDGNTIVLTEDAEGPACLCPSPDAKAMVAKGSEWWLPAPDRPGLFVNPPAGRHAIVLLLLTTPFPAEVEHALTAGQLAWGLDRAAAWVQGDNVGHRLYRTEFLAV